MLKFLKLLAATLAMALLASGCSMIPGLGSQSGPQACAAISDEVQSAGTTFAQAIGSASSNPKAAAAAVQKFESSLSSARSKVTNSGVGAALDKLSAASKSLLDILNSASSNPSGLDQTKLTTATNSFQSALSELATACTKA